MAHTNLSSALKGANEIEITVTGRTSGRSLSYPVWFALEGDKLYLIPVRGSDSDWYKNLRKTPTIRLAAGGKTFTTSACLLTNEAQIGKALEQFRDKYGRNVQSYYPGSTWPSKSHSGEMPTRFWHVVSRWIAMRSIARPEGWQRRDTPCTSSALPAVATLSVWFWLVGSIEMIITSLDESIADVEIAPTHSEWN